MRVVAIVFLSCVWIEVKKSCLIESALFGKDVHVSVLFLVLDAFVLKIIPNRSLKLNIGNIGKRMVAKAEVRFSYGWSI